MRVLHLAERIVLSPLRITMVVVSLSVLLVAYQWPTSEPVLEHSATKITENLKGSTATFIAEDSYFENPTQTASTEFDETVSQDNAWQLIEEVESVQHELTFERQDVPGKELLKLNRSLLVNIEEGEKLPLYIPQLNSEIEVQIYSVTLLPSGNRSITGKVHDHPLLDFTMTISEKATLATLGTFEGVFNLRGDAEHAWIVRGKDYNHHVDPNVLDYRLPRQEQITPAEST